MSAMDDSPVPLLPLVHAAARGEAVALERFLVEIYTPTRKALERRYYDLREAEAFIDDVMQETLIHIADHIHECTAVDNAGVGSWVHTIADHAALDELRRSAMRVASRTVEIDPDIAQSAPALDDWPESNAHDVGGEDDTIDRALCALVCRAQDKLAELTVAILWHRLIEGASWKTVAADLRAVDPTLTAKAAQNRFQRALTRLAEIVRALIAALPSPHRETLEAYLERLQHRRHRRRRGRHRGTE